MIPLKLQIKNFVSYGATQEIDFGPYNLICLSGKNGHGKSALLDALTWALWGQARKVGGIAKSEEGLLRLGQTHMMVSLDFQTKNSIYRVRREFTTAGNKNQTNLEFGMLDGSVENFRPLTDKTIRATQKKIEDLIGLDYESFINSAFLKQGQANEFSKKTPKERKEILATILGLDKFEALRRIALDKNKEIQLQREHFSARIEQLKEELLQKPIVQEQIAKITQLLTENGLREKTIETELHELTLKKQTILAQKNQVEKIAFQKQHLETALDTQRREIVAETNLFRAIARQQRSRSRLPNIEKERTVLQTELQQLQFHAAKKIQLKEELIIKKESLSLYVQQIETKINVENEKIVLENQAIDLSLQAVRAKNEEMEKSETLLKQELEKLSAEEALLNGLPSAVSQELIAQAEKKLERRKGYYHAFNSRAQSITAHSAELKQKKQLISVAQQAQCPLCEQDADKEALGRKFEDQQRLYAHQLARLTTLLPRLKSSLLEEHEALEQLKKAAEAARINEIKKAELVKQKVKLRAQADALALERKNQITLFVTLREKKVLLLKQLQEISHRMNKIADDAHYKTMHYAVNELNKQIELVPANPEREKIIHEKLTELSTLAEQQTIFLKEVAQQEERKRAVHNKCKAARELKQQITFLAATLTPLMAYKNEEAVIAAQEVTIMQTLQLLIKEKESLIHGKGSLEAQWSSLLKLQEEFEKYEKLLKELSEQSDEYTTIAAALGKDGIQALLIEEAIPEIEQAANDLLSRLTDNQAHLSIESLRDLKSGKTKESLDIKISDAVGIRAYELYSGGEAFRIDFALRIAISKLLARRAGTALQTLIIDEGFGSQDDEGLSNIMESLYAIQDDFAKIIIVSHLPSMKEQFPVHFHVSKTSQGSTVQVIEHC